MTQGKVKLPREVAEAIEALRAENMKMAISCGSPAEMMQ